MKKSLKISLLFVLALAVFNIVVSLTEDAFKAITEEQADEIVFNGTPEDVKNLISQVTDLNNITFRCNSLLISAIKSSYSDWKRQHPEYSAEKIEVLINAGADVNQKIDCVTGFIPPISWAVRLPAEFQSSAVADFMSSLETKIQEGEEYCDIPKVISKPCNTITEADKKYIKRQMTEIITASQKELEAYFLKIVQIMVENGADINQADSNGVTPLHYALLNPEKISQSIVWYLIEKGSNLNSQDKDGNTPLFFARAKGNKVFEIMLINAGARTDIRNNSGALYSDTLGITEFSDYMNNQGYIERRVK